MGCPKEGAADRYFWGCYDLDGDATPEIITSTEKARRFQPLTTLQAVDGRTGRDMASVESAALSTGSLPLPPDIAFHANRSTPIFAELPGKLGAGLLVRREASRSESLWALSGGISQFAPLVVTPNARIAFLGQQGKQLLQPDLELAGPQNTAVSPSVSGPLVSMAGGKRELIAARADGFIVGGVD
jgi:hypothetical protein